MIHSEKKTGRLEVLGDRHHATIYYQKGFIVFIDSDLTQAYSLGSLLLTHNIIGEVEIRKALEVAEAEGKRLGVILVRRGYISQEKLVNLLRYQFKEIIATVLAWRTGTFSYSEGLTDYAQDIRFEIDPVRLLSEAQKWRQYRNLIPNDRAVFKITESSFFSDSSFREGVLRVMLLIDGERTITQIIAETGFSRLAVYKAVKQLASSGAIVRKNAKVAGQRFDPAPLIGIYLESIEEIVGVIALELGKRQALDCLHNSLINSGQYETFLKIVPVDTDARGRLAPVLDYLKKNGSIISKQDLVSGFDSVVSGLLDDVRQLLGEKAHAAALDRIDSPAISINKPSGADGRPVADQTAMLSFLSQAIGILAKDLENEIGRQAFPILQGVLEGSNAYPDFIAAFDVVADDRYNTDKMVDCLKRGANKYDSRGLTAVCGQVIADIVNEERRFLGNRAVQLSLDKIEDRVADMSPDRLKTLAAGIVSAVRES